MTQAKYNLSRFACLSDKENLDRFRPSGCPVNCVLFVILTTNGKSSSEINEPYHEKDEAKATHKSWYFSAN